jgi:hypothetical protein
MANIEGLTKRVAINKANAQVVIVVGIASFVTVFCLMASKGVWSQTAYQGRVKSATSKANLQLASNITAYNSLAKSYESFATTTPNDLGGQISGTAQNSGNNAKIILDALPAAYDFPGLTSTLQKILTNGSFQVQSIGGADDQLTEGINSSSANPVPVSIPFTFTVINASYQSIGQLIQTLQESIRPIVIDNFQLGGDENDLTITVSAHTYYQPAKTLSITKQEVQ